MTLIQAICASVYLAIGILNAYAAYRAKTPFTPKLPLRVYLMFVFLWPLVVVKVLLDEVKS